MPLTRIKPQGLDSTGTYTFNGIIANTAIVAGNDISSGGGPKITNIQVTDSSYNVLDDTSVSTSGGYIKITGTGFASGCQVLINNTPVTSVTFVSATEVRAQVPATSAGTYVVYLVNSDGGVAIRVNGITFSGTPNWVTSSTLPNSDPLVSIQLSATSDSAVVYSLAAGSTLPTGITLSSGGLLSGTVTGTDQTTYNFTINAIDAELQDSPRTFSITITFSDLNFPYVTTLISANTATLPYDSDASNNNFAITPNGDVRPNGFNPYTPGYYSNYFDGTGDYLTVPSTSSLSMGTGDFCIEMWIYPTALSATSQVLYANFSAGTTQMGVFIRNTSTIRFSSWDTAYLDSASGSIVNNIWHHIVVCRATTTTSLFINGVRAATATGASNDFSSSSAFSIGRNPNNTEFFPGYISNLRVIKGSALYNPSSTTITVPTTPLTAIANTSLLTCQSNGFIDNSTNAFTITRNGDTLVSGFDPFVPDTSYGTYGSTYFDGTGDYLAPATNSAFAFGTGDFTFECWIYATTANDSPIYESRSTNSTTDGFTVTAFSSTVIRVYTTAVLVSATVSNYVNTWTHVAFTRQGSTNRLFVNGVLGATATAADNFSNTTAFIGAGRYASSSLSAYFTGYISDARIVKGTAVYTSAFTPPTTPLTAIANTSLLTCQTNQPDNNNILLDSSTNNFLITRNGNTTQGTFSPYGPLWSNYFDGTGDYLTIPYSASMVQWWDTDYTIEMWVYNVTNSQTSNGFPLQVAYGLPAQADTYWSFGTLTNGTLMFYYYNGGAVTSAVSSATVPLNTWTHVAMVYTNSSTTLKGYINGVQAFSVSKSGTPQGPSGQTVNLGAVQSTGYNGYISNLRIVRGTAVYTSAFTPSTSPLTAIANTSLLTCTDNRFVDDSPNNFTITRNGDVSVQRFSPFSPQTVTTFYSGYFDGTGDWLVTTTSPATLSGSFTIEGWVYITSLAAGRSLVCVGDDNTSTGALFFVNTSGRLAIFGNGGNILVGTSQTVAVNTWNHIAFVRSSGTITAYLNGVADSTTASNSTAFTGANRIGGELFAGNAGGTIMLGYISNYRLVNGTAVYTSAFTPPTQPLTAISGTSLLTCQSATFIDNSTNNFTITVAGNTTPTTVAPFTPTATTGVAYSPSVYGGSMYFDGSGDYLTVPPSTTTYLSNRAFTIEAWVYLNANYVVLVSRRAEVSARGFFLTYGNITDNKFTFYAGDTDGGFWNVQLTSTDTFSLRQWHHVVITRNSSNVFTLWVNGVSQATGTASFTIADDTSNLLIGAIDSGNAPMNGYISNLRIITGQALYTSNFAPPVSPLIAIQNSVLLLNGTSAGVYDSSMMNDYETVGNSNLVTSIKKYGNSSLYFDGTGDYLATNSTLITNFGARPFTIESWVYFNSVSGTRYIMSTYQDSGTGWALGLFNSKFNFWATGDGADIVGTTTPVINTWYHLAVSGQTGSIKLFVNGIQEGSTYTGATALNSTSTLRVGDGAGAAAGQALNGYLDDVRITRGAARYTANFTPPSSPFITK
jgi:hypothetical protein